MAGRPRDLRRAFLSSGLFAIHRPFTQQALMVAVSLMLMWQPLNGNHKRVR